MDTMYTSVLERTKQIGIMKAIGASRDAIMSLFLIESGVIGLVGGALGIVSGLVVSYLIGLVAAGYGAPGLFSWAAIDYFELVVILIITFITGVLSGLFPARAASRLEPAEALRYE
jgi:putative ABC transport system permease protein